MQSRTGNAITLRVLNGFRCELEEHPQMMSSSSLHRRATPLCLDPEILHMVKIRLVLYISDQIEEKTLKKFCSKKWLSPGIRLVVYISDQIEGTSVKPITG